VKGVLGALVVAVLFATACNTLEKSAREDPMKCERDPKCEKKRGRTQDCSMQCSDDPACVERCEQIQQQNGRLGR
jgi:hypothetical protein